MSGADRAAEAGTLLRVPELGAFAFGLRIPYLPDILGSAEEAGAIVGHPVLEAYSRQVSFLRALAALAPSRCALQVRLITWPGTGRCTDIVILGRGATRADAEQLQRLVTFGLPIDAPLESLDGEGLRASLDPLGGCVLDGGRFAEVRRALEPVDPTLPPRARTGPYDMMIMPWQWSSLSLTHSLHALAGQSGVTVLAAHAEPRLVTDTDRRYLESAAREAKNSSSDGVATATLARQLATDRLRLLRRHALHVRLFLASAAPLYEGLSELIGADLAGRGHEGPDRAAAFDVVVPRSADDVVSVGRMLRCLDSPIWGVPSTDTDLRSLLFLFDPQEANVAVRIPVTPRGGLPGIATARRSRILRGAPAEAQRGPAIHLGLGPSAGRVAVTLEDVRRHLVVAGTPGSGKTTTVQHLLMGLQAAGIPFLVIDPAKTDYGDLVRSLRDEGATVEHVRLSPSSVGFNPMSVPSGASTLGYAGRVLAAFDSAFQLSRFFPLGRMLLSQAIRRAYGDAALEDRSRRDRHPTLADLYRHTRAVIREQNLSTSSGADASASLLGRLDYLMDGGLGDCLLGDSAAGIDWEKLCGRSTVIELGAFASPEERALLFGLLLAGLVTYREANPSKQLSHVTVLEEAHRLLRRDADDFGAATFADAIAELRGAGEGFFVVDQTPSLLLPQVTRTVGSFIAHRLVDPEERRVACGMLLLTRGQSSDLARLPVGRAYIYTAGMSDPLLVDVQVSEDLRDEPTTSAVTDEGGGQSRATSGHATVNTLCSVAAIQRAWCKHCPKPCVGYHGLEKARDLAGVVVPALETGLDGERLEAILGHAAQAMDTTPNDLRVFCATARALADGWAAHPERLRRALVDHATIAERVARATARNSSEVAHVTGASGPHGELTP